MIIDITSGSSNIIVMLVIQEVKPGLVHFSLRIFIPLIHRNELRGSVYFSSRSSALRLDILRSVRLIEKPE